MNVAYPPLRAAIVTVGDELLLGETVDSNAAWLGRELSSLGVPVVERFTVGDVDDDIRRAVRRATDAAELVLVTGGLGPTKDDRTRPAVADLLGAPLRVDPDLLEALEARFRSRGFTRLPPLNHSQAEIPEGASILANPRGTAPGLALLTDGGALVVLLPGVPDEMRDIVRGDFRAVLAETFGDRLRPLHHRLIHTTGIAESELAGRLEDALPGDMGPVSLAFLPDLRGVDLRLTARGVDEARAREWLDRVEAALSPVVGPFRFEAETGDLVEAVSRALEDVDLVMAAAESCTGGLVAKRMTDRPGSSRVFRGGIVAYANQVKVDVLGVDAATLESEGAVSEPVARQMALGVCRALDAPVGVGVTGIAGPEGGSDEKPVGLVWYAVSIRGRVEARSQVFGPDREGIRERSAQAVLADLLRRLEATS
jgi:nicotinamide-nucleotide amidase